MSKREECRGSQPGENSCYAELAQAMHMQYGDDVIMACQEAGVHLYVTHDVQCSSIVALRQQQLKRIL